jgi:hypothetical protein
MSIFEKYDLVDVNETFPIPDLPKEGLVLLTGSSGSGKSTILRSVFGECNDINFDHNPLYANFSNEECAEKYLLACGLRTIPTWKRPYSNLSNGEQHRAYCAKCLDIGIEYIDEFSSVVDRDTAKALSYSIQKYFRASGRKRLVIASCHNDIKEWLNPDHVYNTDMRSWEFVESDRRLLRRPPISLEIKAVNGKSFWPIFQKHHYLSGSFNNSANSFVAFINSKPIAFCSILRFPNANFSNGWREHRTVVIPEFQGLGIGVAFSECIASMVISAGGRFFSKTSHPSFGVHRNKSCKWKPTSKNGKKRLDYNKNQNTKEDGHKMKHRNRLCYSHEYIG